MGSEVAARWKLASELLAVGQLDARLARELAGGLRTRQWYTAVSAAHAALEEYGPELERYMRERAPALWAHVADLLREYPPEVLEPRLPVQRKAGGKIGRWPGGVVAMVVVALIRLLGIPSHASSNAETVNYSEPEPARLCSDTCSRSVSTAPGTSRAARATRSSEALPDATQEPAQRRCAQCEAQRSGERRRRGRDAGAHAEARQIGSHTKRAFRQKNQADHGPHRGGCVTCPDQLSGGCFRRFAGTHRGT